MSWSNNTIVRLILPWIVFLGAFTFYEGFFRVFAACDCFFNYRDWIFVVETIIFSVGFLVTVHLMKRKQKEYRFLYSIVAIILFLIIYYTIMALGERLYVGSF